MELLGYAVCTLVQLDDLTNYASSPDTLGMFSHQMDVWILFPQWRQTPPHQDDEDEDLIWLRFVESFPLSDQS